jgi:hypothetical protein
VTNVALPVVTGAVGIAGGVLLGRTALQRERKILGVPVPGLKVDLSDISKNIGDAGRQFGKLAREVQTAREKAEQIARVFS